MMKLFVRYAAHLGKSLLHKGSPLAQGLLGVHYSKGLGVEKDLTKSLRLIKRGAQTQVWQKRTDLKGIMYSQYVLALIYKQKNVKKALCGPPSVIKPQMPIYTQFN